MAEIKKYRNKSYRVSMDRNVVLYIILDIIY